LLPGRLLSHLAQRNGLRSLVIHPLDDVREEKVDTRALGPMPMTEGVRISLLSLRAILVLMMLLVFYHVLDLAGLFGHHA